MPNTPAHIVDRPGLIGKLDGALGAPLTVVVAQAGSGKSVLLAQWAAAHPETRFARVDVVGADDDPVHFARALFTALAGVDPAFAAVAPLVALGDGGLGEALLEALVLQLRETGELVIVLDDLHHLSNPLILRDLAVLSTSLPPTAHVVISSREELPFAFRRGALAGAVEIRQRDLAVTFADSSELLKRVTGRTITTANVRALVDRTEGWVAGLLLAGVSLRAREDSDAFVAQFAGSDRLVSEYLGEEVLQAQSPARRQALLRMSVLDEMSAELVDHLFEEATTQLLFEELERSSMFLVPLDERREWYRFHHLFGDMLRYRLRAEDPTAELALLVRAAEWHLERAETPAAVEYLLRAREWDRALDAILAQGPSVFERGEMATVVNWIGRVPANRLAQRPDVITIAGILTGLDGHAAEAEDVLLRVVNEPSTPFGLAVCAQTFIATLAQWRPHPEVSVHNAERALDMLGRLGDRAIPDLLHLSHPRLLEATALFSGGRALFLLGRFAEARDWLLRSLASEGSSYSLWRISSLGSLALLEAWCGRTVRAERLAAEALSTAKDVGSLTHPSIADAYLALTVVALERGEPARAQLPLQEAIARIRSNGRTQLLWVAHRLEKAIREAGASEPEGLDEPDGPPPPLVVDGPASTELIDDTRPLRAVERLLVRARGAEREGDTDASVRLLGEAIAIAEPEHLVDVFNREGGVVMDRLVKMPYSRSRFREPILARWNQRKAPSAGAAGLLDPLTGRELQILRFLPTHLTTAELAEEFFVSINTIKTHMAHIYSKLDATSRGAAVRRARELGLLPDAA